MIGTAAEVRSGSAAGTATDRGAAGAAAHFGGGATPTATGTAARATAAGATATGGGPDCTGETARGSDGGSAIVGLGASIVPGDEGLAAPPAWNDRLQIKQGTLAPAAIAAPKVSVDPQWGQVSWVPGMSFPSEETAARTATAPTVPISLQCNTASKRAASIFEVNRGVSRVRENRGGFTAPVHHIHTA